MYLTATLALIFIFYLDFVSVEDPYNEYIKLLKKLPDGQIRK